MEFILLLLSSSLLLTARSAAATFSDPVYDLDGKALRRGHQYWAMSPRTGSALTLAKSASCPLNVTETFEFDDFSPLAFFPENTKVDYVKEGSTLNIMFAKPTECADSTVWTFDTKADVLTTGGTSSSAADPHYSRFTIHKAKDPEYSGFAIHKEKNYYQIQVCPCSTDVEWHSCEMECIGNLGLGMAGEIAMFHINNIIDPHNVFFVEVKKKEEEAASS